MAATSSTGRALSLFTCLIFLATGCACGDRVASRSITITETRGVNSGAWGPVEIDTTQLPGAERSRIDRTDSCGNPVSELRLFPNRPIKVMIVPAIQPPQQPIDLQSLHGSLAQVVQINHLDRYHSWPLMNLPPDEDPGIIYFLDHGDLTLRYHGDPPLLRRAEFWPSDKSADQRFQSANAGWDAWVKAHTSKQR